jgi:predicted Zn-ribbon and HTH transcriptional regulator
MIYELVLSETYFGSVYIPSFFWQAPLFTEDIRTRPPALLQVSSVIRQETAPMWYGHQLVKIQLRYPEHWLKSVPLRKRLASVFQRKDKDRRDISKRKHLSTVLKHARWVDVELRGKCVSHHGRHGMRVAEVQTSSERSRIIRLKMCRKCGFQDDRERTKTAHRVLRDLALPSGTLEQFHSAIARVAPL